MARASGSKRMDFAGSSNLTTTTLCVPFERTHASVKARSSPLTSFTMTERPAATFAHRVSIMTRRLLPPPLAARRAAWTVSMRRTEPPSAPTARLPPSGALPASQPNVSLLSADGLLSSHASPCVRTPEREPPTHVPSWSERHAEASFQAHMATNAEKTAAHPMARAGPSSSTVARAASTPGSMAPMPSGGSSAARRAEPPARGATASQTSALSVGHQHASATPSESAAPSMSRRISAARSQPPPSSTPSLATSGATAASVRFRLAVSMSALATRRSKPPSLS